MVSLALATVALADQAALDSAKFKFEVDLEQLEKKAHGPTIAGYRGKLEALRQIYKNAGDLDAVLEIKAAVDALDANKPAPATELPRLRLLNDLYIKARAEQETKQLKDARRKLFVAYAIKLNVIKQNSRDDAAAVKAVDEAIAAANESLKNLEHAGFFSPGGIMRGRMHIDVDDQVTFYVNGKKLRTFRRNPSNKGKFVSPVFELAIGDRFLVSARNSGGGLRHLKIVFISEDEKLMTEFRVADFKDLKPILGERRDFTIAELSSDEALPARLDADKFGKTFDFENNSEWIWGKGNHSLLATVIKPAMCRVR